MRTYALPHVKILITTNKNTKTMYNEAKEYAARHSMAALRPRAVLFDMDGVLFDSMPNHARSWHESMSTFGLDMAPEAAYTYEGMRGVETIKLLARQQWHRELDDSEAENMYRVKSEAFRRCPKAAKMPGVEQLMRKIKAEGMKIVIVTGSGQRSLLDNLEAEFAGLVSKNLIVTSFDVEHGKPSPEPYLRGLDKAGISPTEGVVVENAPLGVRSAVAAGIFTIAVNTGPLPDEALAREGANIVFKDMPALCNAWDTLFT